MDKNLESATTMPYGAGEISKRTIVRLKSWQINEVRALLHAHAGVQISFSQMLCYCIQACHEAYVAVRNEMIIGVIAGSHSIDGNEANIDMLCVHRSYRRNGWGRTLINSFLKECCLDGKCSLNVRLSNSPALALYQQYGFVASGKKSLYYTNEDALTMVRELHAIPSNALLQT